MNYLEKGTKVLVEGRLQYDNWEDDSGTTRYATKIVAEEMQIVD